MSLAVCNLVFWSVIVPITTYGSEVRCLSDIDLENLESFQRWAGRRIERFPNISS